MSGSYSFQSMCFSASHKCFGFHSFMSSSHEMNNERPRVKRKALCEQLISTRSCLKEAKLNTKKPLLFSVSSAPGSSHLFLCCLLIFLILSRTIFPCDQFGNVSIIVILTFFFASYKQKTCGLKMNLGHLITLTV